MANIGLTKTICNNLTLKQYYRISYGFLSSLWSESNFKRWIIIWTAICCTTWKIEWTSVCLNVQIQNSLNPFRYFLRAQNTILNRIRFYRREKKCHNCFKRCWTIKPSNYCIDYMKIRNAIKFQMANIIIIHKKWRICLYFCCHAMWKYLFLANCANICLNRMHFMLVKWWKKFPKNVLNFHKQ